VIGARRADSPALYGDPRHPLVLRDGVPHREIMAAFAAAAVVAVPSRWPSRRAGCRRGDGLRVPVVASEVGGLAELVLPGETGLLVRPGDAVRWPARSTGYSATPRCGPGWVPPRRRALSTSPPRPSFPG